MNIAITIFLGLLSCFFALGMIADEKKDNRRNFTIAFAVCVIGALVINIL